MPQKEKRMSRETDRQSASVRSDTSAASSGSGESGKNEEPTRNSLVMPSPSIMNRRQGHRAAIKQKKVEEIHGHKFAKVYFKKFTFCSFCNNFIWGVTSPQGYRCQLCNKAVHKKCRKDIVDNCTKSAKTSEHSLMIRERFKVDVPHRNTDCTVKGPTFCDHCGNMVGFLSKARKCTACNCFFHKKCEHLLDNTCGLNTKMMVEAIKETRRTSVSSAAGATTVESVFSDIKAESDRKYGAGDFCFTHVLGKGSFGKVLLGSLTADSRKLFAVKAMRKDVALDDDDIETASMERKVLVLATECPFLTHLFCTFQSKTHLFFVMEFLNGGDLLYHIQRDEKFTAARTKFYCAETIVGLEYLHCKDIIYRDLKLDNLMLDKEGHIKLTDFGMCKALRREDKTSTFCGTPDYIAPEILLNKKYNRSVDFWALGVLTFEMLVGNSPFLGDTDDQLFEAILKMDPMLPRSLEPECKAFIRELLVRDPSNRLGMTKTPIRQHAFFRGTNWSKLEKREIQPPFKPNIGTSNDPKNFDGDFLAEPVKLTPVENEIANAIDQGLFKGFSFTSQYPLPQ